MAEDITTIQVSNDLWKKLNGMKEERGVTFEDVIWDLIKRGRNGNNTN